MVQSALSQSGLSQREQEQVRAEVRTRGVSAALGLVNALKQAAQARLAALEARVTRMEERLDEAQQSSKSPTVPYPRRPPYPDPETADMTEAERLAEYKQSAAYQARQARYRQWEAQQAYLRYRQGEWANPQPMAQPAESKPLWQRVGDWVANHLNDIAGAISGLRDAFAVRHLRFNRLPDGHISVRAETPPGTRWAYRQTVAEVMNSKADEFFAGTRYNPSTVAARTAGGLLRSAWSKGNIALAGMTSLASNLWTFGTNPEEGATFWDRTVKNREFWVSMAVDTVVSVAVGVAAAAVVGGIVALLAPVVTVALPVAIVATTIVGIGIGMAIDAVPLPGTNQSFPSWAKAKVNEWFSGKLGE